MARAVAGVGTWLPLSSSLLSRLMGLCFEPGAGRGLALAALFLTAGAVVADMREPRTRPCPSRSCFEGLVKGRRFMSTRCAASREKRRELKGGGVWTR